MHYVLEGGFANAQSRGANISFDASSYFLSAGFDKYFFDALFDDDLDNAFVGLRLGGAQVMRGEAQATVWDPFYGNTTALIAPSNKMVYWIGLTAGFRLELLRNVFVGWNARGGTFLNPSNIKELTPEYIAGYGAAKKQPTFDYNLYLLYGFGKR